MMNTYFTLDKFRLISLLPILFFFSFSSCTKLLPEDANEGAKQACGQISARYIADSIDANLIGVSNNIYVSKFLENQNITSVQYQARLSNLKNKWILSNHPLANLSIKNIEVNGDDAVVSMQRQNIDKKSFPIIKIILLWTGSSWTIIDDNIIGKGEIFDSFK